MYHKCRPSAQQPGDGEDSQCRWIMSEATSLGLGSRASDLSALCLVFAIYDSKVLKIAPQGVIEDELHQHMDADLHCDPLGICTEGQG